MIILGLRLWSLLNSCVLTGRVFRERGRQKFLSTRFRLAIKIPMRYAVMWTHLKRVTGCYPKGYRLREQVAVANQKCLLPDAVIDYTRTAQRRELLEFYATWGQDKQILQQIDRCAEELRPVIQQVLETNTPVILAPLHMTSDIVAAIVSSKASSLKTTIVVSSNAMVWNKQARKLGDIDIDYCSVEQDAKEVGLDLASVCMDVAVGERTLVMFADMVPDYTSHQRDNPQDKIKCRLFGRPAHLHNGLPRLAKVTRASVVFFYLYDDHGLNIKVLPPVKYGDVATAMPDVIEQAIRQAPKDWLLWHQHCLYFINERT